MLGAVRDDESLRELMACGHRKGCQGTRYEEFFTGQEPVPYCTTCERERKLVETAVQMTIQRLLTHNATGSGWAAPTFEDVRKEAGL